MRKSKTNWVRLKIGAVNGPTSAHPETNIRHMVRGVVRHGLKRWPQTGARAAKVRRALAARAKMPWSAPRFKLYASENNRLDKPLALMQAATLKRHSIW